MDKKDERKCVDSSNNNIPADILIVDDVYANVFLIENMLSEYYCVASVDSANEMRRYLMHSKPKLILLDLMMPFEDGFSILERLAANEDLAKIPVIVVSARDSREDVLKAMRLGAADYVVKPVEETVLLAKIAKILGE